MADETKKTTNSNESQATPGNDDINDNAENQSGGVVREKEIGGRDGPDPTRFGDWEKAGRCIDF
jgi:hypothetical protein